MGLLMDETCTAVMRCNVHIDSQARVQTFEKGGTNLRHFTKGVRILINSDFEAKIMGVNSVSGDKLHDFEIICPAMSV